MIAIITALVCGGVIGFVWGWSYRDSAKNLNARGRIDAQ